MRGLAHVPLGVGLGKEHEDGASGGGHDRKNSARRMRAEERGSALQLSVLWQIEHADEGHRMPRAAHAVAVVVLPDDDTTYARPALRDKRIRDEKLQIDLSSGSTGTKGAFRIESMAFPSSRMLSPIVRSSFSFRTLATISRDRTSACRRRRSRTSPLTR
jgi:hypothetical protein